MITRRYFVTGTAVTLFSAGFLPSVLRRACAALADGPPRAGRRRVLVVVFMRGAVDGLNVVVPHGDADYYAARPEIAVARPGGSSLRAGANESALDLDGHFGFHPRLSALKPLFDAHELAVVQAVGSPDNTRSHFDAQDYMESATPGVKSTPDGWLNRYLQLGQAKGPNPFRGVAVTQRAPRSLQGRASTLVLEDIASFHLGPRRGRSLQAEAYSAEVERMYGATKDALLAATAREMFQAVRELDRVEPEATDRDTGIVYPRGPLGKSLGEVAALIKAGVGLEIAFVEVGGWDHHVNEGGVDGKLARNLEPFAAALAAFRRDLGERMEDVLLLTMSEFGRTVQENGNRGTDHGHGNVMLALGAGVRGGRVYGAWPGLRPSARFEGRDLAVTTDFRDVLAEALVRHLGCVDPAPVFPGYRISRERSLGYLAA
jgi:uncharacterized protein (DUF1501 family)